MVDEKLLTGYLKKKGCSKSSIASYVHSARCFTTWAASRHRDTEFTTYSELIDYMAYLKQRALSQRTVQSYMMGVMHYFEALVQAGVVVQNPARYLTIKANPARKLYTILNREQLENLYIAFDVKAMRQTKPSARASAIRNKVATGLMVYQGLDVATLAKLTTKDVDVLGGAITIKRGRVYNGRTLGLQAVQIIEMDRYISQTRKELQSHFKQPSCGTGREESGLLLVTGYANYRDAHKRLVQRLKKQYPYLQSSQHIKTSVITHWLKQYNLREVQYMAGHRRIKSTEAYQRNDTEGLQLDVDRFHPLG